MRLINVNKLCSSTHNCCSNDAKRVYWHLSISECENAVLLLMLLMFFPKLHLFSQTTVIPENHGTTGQLMLFPLISTVVDLLDRKQPREATSSRIQRAFHRLLLPQNIATAESSSLRVLIQIKTSTNCFTNSFLKMVPFFLPITVFENHRKSLIQHCEQSELRLHFECSKVNSKCQKWCILACFWKREACGQTVLPDRSVLIGQKLGEDAKIQMRHFE